MGGPFERNDVYLKKKKSALSKKEKLFCLSFINSLDVELSAKAAGYTKNPLKKGQALLLKNEIADEIAQLQKLRERAMKNSSVVGLQKIAFSPITDAVSLLYMDKPSKEILETLDLFMVQEIKKPKDGAMEIKFFDRLKALEKLGAQSPADENSGSLLDAIRLGAQKLSEGGE